MVKKSDTFEYRIETNQKVIPKLDQFNKIGTKNWKKEYFNSAFPDSFLVTARNPDGEIVGTQGFMSFYLNNFGQKALVHKSERTLLSPECRGKGVFKRQVEIGKNHLINQGSLFCFGCSDARKAFSAAGFDVYYPYRFHEIYSISLFWSVIKCLRYTVGYLVKDLKRLYKKQLNIDDLYKYILLMHVIACFKKRLDVKNKITKTLKTKNKSFRFKKFSLTDKSFTKGLVSKFNKRNDGIYLWLDEELFSRLAENFPFFYHISLQIEDITCELVLEKIDNGYFKIVACSDYKIYYKLIEMFNYELKENGICELMTIRNKECVSVKENCSNHKNFTRHSGFGTFFLIENSPLKLRDLEVEEIWLLL